MKLEGHYHLDVFRADGRFLRGFTLQREADSPRYRIVDDAGFAGLPGTALSEPLPLEDALRQGLAATRKHVRGPITPAFGSAPFELLGFERPRLFRPAQEIDEDGRPGAAFRWRRGSARDRVLVEKEEDGVGVHSSPRGAWRASFTLSRRARRIVLVGEAVEKPLAVVRERSPTWIRDTTFAFDLFFRLLERAPGGSRVERVWFENPSAGPTFVPADLVPRGGDPAVACAEAAVGNKAEDGRMLVNGRPVRFRCDCLSRVDLWIALPEGGSWLTRAALQELSGSVAERWGVVVRE